MKIIYIAGSGRSGSTLLQTLLSRWAQVLPLGELYNLPKWLRQNRVCGCGESIGDCGFWQKLADASHGVNPDLDALVPLRASLPADSARFVLSILTRKSYFRFPDEGAAWKTIFAGALRECGATIVVDSSKELRRLLALRATADLDVWMVHLVRDARGYIRSKGLHKVFETPRGRDETRVVGPLVASWFWMKTNALAWLVGRRLFRSRYCLVRYEDLADAPEEELNRIAKRLDLEGSRAGVPEVSHTVAGNNVKFSGFDNIRNDDQWRTSLTLSQKASFYAVAAWLNCLLKGRRNG